jgi:hypothetical protein
MAIRILSSENITGNLTVNGIAQIGASADANFSLGSSGDTFVLTSKKNGTDGIPMIFKVQASGGTIYERINITSGSRTNIDVMSTFASEGIIRIGRYDANISRYNEIKNSVTSNGADSYMKLSVHSGTENVVTDVMTLLGDGNVGIGDESPSTKIDVYQSTVGIGAADFRHVNGNRILINPSYNYYDAYNHIFRGLSGTDTHMTIDLNGNVGIGTTTPQKKVHIEGTGAASEMQILVSSASDTVGHTAGIGLRAEGGEADGDFRIKGGIFFERIAGSFGNGKMILAVNSSVSNTSVTVADHALTIDTNKNVGIGTTDPANYKLYVSGNIKSSTLTVYDGMGGTETGIGASEAGGNLRLYTGGVNRVTVQNTNQTMILYGNSTTGSNYMQFMDSQGTSQGYLGYGSGSSNVLYLVQQKSDDIQFYSNGSTRMTINTDGNIGIGVAPETNMVTYIKQLRIGEQSGFQGHADGVGQDSATWVTTNFKFSTSGAQFINGTAAAPGYANQYQQQLGDHSFNCSTVAGAAGDAIVERTQMVLKQSGNVLKPNSCAFSASTTTPGVSVGTTEVKITYDTENVDANGNYDTTLSRFTAPVAGNYLIGTTNTCYISTVVTQYMAIYIRKNGVATSYRFRGGAVDNQVNDWFGINGSVIIPLAQGDYIELFGYTNAGSFQIVNTEGHFYGYLIG